MDLRGFRSTCLSGCKSTISTPRWAPSHLPLFFQTKLGGAAFTSAGGTVSQEGTEKNHWFMFGFLPRYLQPRLFWLKPQESNTHPVLHPVVHHTQITLARGFSHGWWTIAQNSTAGFTVRESMGSTVLGSQSWTPSWENLLRYQASGFRKAPSSFLVCRLI